MSSRSGLMYTLSNPDRQSELIADRQAAGY